MQRLLQRRRVVEENPFDDRQRQAAVLDQVVVKLSEAEVRALFFTVASEQIHNLPFADDVADFLCRA